ncbi:probable serine/threonine-protein kinase pats1 [Stylophora pistillata]|uniref:probable serine/threonine-protein kinase pats1 n=1 Tax=Stylophora pistillata TaxID=50429 RepID=UPI000C0462D4|nr:probable serine/threonine-protein kinase pats1 [Stylophora pistillata]
MESNSIEELRKKIKIRDGRKILYLSGHSLEELPVAVMELIELEELYLTNNKLKTIPENIRKLINLTRLDLYGNQLSIFPASLSQLKKLKWLDISWNEWLTTDAIGEMEELEILFLKENQLTVLSSSITQLKKLKELYITGNKLTTIPDAIGEMVGLEVLELNYNKLTELSPAIKQLKKLKVLSISQNQLTTIPDSIGEMVDLEKLDLSHNQLTVLSSNIKQLKKLEWLKISYNKLTTVPNAIGEMVNLKTLNLSYNQLSVLPSSAIKQLKKLESLYVDGNPTFTAEGMRSVMELEDKIDRVYSAIPDYVERLRPEGREVELAYERALKDGYVEVYRGRIMLIGQERAGKTSLKKSLLGLPFDPEEQSTEGIIVDPSKCEIDVNQVRNWQSTNKNKPVLLEHGKGIADILLGDMLRRQGKDAEDSTRKEEDSEESSVEDSSDDEAEAEEDKGGENFQDSKEENSPNEPEVQIDSSPPDDIMKYLHQGLEYVKCRGDINREVFLSLDMWDFAGQHLYYASHPIFLSSRALYVLVHNLSKPLDALAEPCVRQGTVDIRLENSNNETNIENLLSWLATVHSVAQAPVTDDTDNDAQHKLPYLRPPVFIVGTHADKPVDDIAVMKKQIKERISGKEYEKHVVRPLYCIDNTRSSLKEPDNEINADNSCGDAIHLLQNRIMEVLRKEPYMGEKIPISVYFIYGIYTSIFKRTCTAASFILKQDLSYTPLHLMYQINSKDPLYTKYWQELEGSGILSMEHVDHVFSSFIDPMQGIDKEDILGMMEQFGLIAKFSVSPNNLKYFVPAQLKSSPDKLLKLKPSLTDPCPVYLFFMHGFVPHGLFLQLVSRSIRFCAETWPHMAQPTLYENGARFIVGKNSHHFALICKTGFIKIILRQLKQSHQVVKQNTAELATVIREFLEATLQALPQELPYLRRLQYRLCVACPYCYQGTEEPLKACSDHIKTTCTHKDCFHLIDANEGNPTICSRDIWDEERTISGLEKWFLRGTRQGSRCSNVTAKSQGAAAGVNLMKSDVALKVTLLGSEWSSSMGGLSTINRQLAILLGKHSQVDVTLLVPQFACSEEERRMASRHNVSLREAQRRPGYTDPLDWLSAPPRDLAIDIVLGHGAKLGKQAQIIRESHQCGWIQVVHTVPEELGMHKNYAMAICKGEEKNTTEVELCELADVVVAVGPKLTKAYSSYLRSCEKHQEIIQLTPSTFSEFSDVKQAAIDMEKFKVLTFGRGDPEDFSLKGYDISARAIVELRDRSCHLIFVGAPDGKQDEVAEDLLESGIDKGQLTVRKFVQSKERLKKLFCEVDLCMMPSRTEGFGLTALEALSAGLPILVSGNSGFGEALSTVPSGKSFVVESEDPKEWAKAIAGVREKERSDRLHEIQQLKTSYEEMYSWEKQCDILVEKMWDISMTPDILLSMIRLSVYTGQHHQGLSQCSQREVTRSSAATPAQNDGLSRSSDSSQLVSLDGKRN